MLSVGEKAYYAALLALKRKEYGSAVEHFRQAAPYFEKDKEFNLYFETTCLLVVVKKELSGKSMRDELEIEEVFSDG